MRLTGKIGADLLDLLPLQRESLAASHCIGTKLWFSHLLCPPFNQPLNFGIGRSTIQPPEVINREHHSRGCGAVICIMRNPTTTHLASETTCRFPILTSLTALSPKTLSSPSPCLIGRAVERGRAARIT